MVCYFGGKVLCDEVLEGEIHLAQFILRCNDHRLIELIKYGLELILLVFLVFEAKKHFLVDSSLKMEECCENYKSRHNCRKDHSFILLKFHVRIFSEYTKYSLADSGKHGNECNRCYENHAFVKVVV